MQYRLLFLLLTALLAACGSSDSQEPAYTNHLINESSPYLLQHAHNPVDWYPWGEEALRKAQEENKMLIISIGYAACHWCHVMEEESFMDTAVARLMNEHFVSIKVDREERPDIDDIYMTACQIATGRGCGWPLNAFALPDGRPVWAGTYFPKKEWLKVLKYFIDLYQKEPDKLNTYAAQLADGIQGVGTITPNEGEPEFTRATLDDLADKFLQEIDFRWGGRKGAPKFPIPNKYQFLLRYHHLSGNPRALEAVTVTLDRMADGGIYDQLGGGFARYATDDQWVVPHFEKMLYDNGQLVSLYAQAWQVTQNPRYRTIVEETLAFVKRELASPEGGFYSSLDADSEGEEGKFYVWTKAEIDSILGGGDLSSMFCDYFEVSRSGNWEDGKNILHRRKPLEEVARTFNLSPEDCLAQINQARQKLFEARAQRPRPRTDDKVLTAWNALMLQGYVDAFKAFGVEAYRERALRTGRFLLQNMLHEDNRLDRNFKDGKSSINAFLDDYALTIQAFIGLYEITFDESWLQKARDLTEYVLEHFDDPQTGLFHYTSDLDPPLVARKMEVSDNVIPASNSVMARNLFALGHYFYDEGYLERARTMLHHVSPEFVGTEHPSFYNNWCILYLDQVRPPYEVAIVGADWDARRAALQRRFLPHAFFLGGKDEGSLELLKGKLRQGETVIYVCQNKVCKLPVTEPERALALMK